MPFYTCPGCNTRNYLSADLTSCPACGRLLPSTEELEQAAQQAAQAAQKAAQQAEQAAQKAAQRITFIATLPQWEYKTILRSRGWESPQTPKNAPWMEATGWDIDTDATLAELGAQGWELVAVVPRSGVLGGREYTPGGISIDYAGFTSQELWVFKRPKG